MAELNVSYDDLLRENAALRATLSRYEGLAEQCRSVQERLCISEERLRRAADSADAVVYDFDLRPGGQRILHGMERVTGVKPEEIEFTLDWWRSRLHPQDAPAYLAALERQLRTGGVVKSVFRILHASGGWLDVESSREVILDRDGNPIRLVGVFVNITQRVAAEAALRESEARYRILADTMPQVVFTASACGLMEYVNRPGLDYMGLALHEATGLGWLAVIHADDREAVADRWLDCMRLGKPYEVEHRMLRADGEYRWQLARAVPITDENGAIVRWIGTSTDIHDRKQADEALRKSHAFIRQIIDTDPNFIFAKDREGRFTLVNRAVADCYGTTVEELLGKTDADFNADADQVAHFRQKDREVIDSLRDLFIPEEIVTDASGAARWLQTVKRPLFDDRGLATQVLGVATDITQRKRTEQALRESEARLQAIMDRAPAAIFIKDRDGRHLFVNKECATVLGMEAAAVMGKTQGELFSQEQAEQLSVNDVRVWESGQAQIFEERIVSADGMHTFLSHKFLLRDAGGAPYALCGIATDITERRKAEEALRESEERFRTLADNMSQLAWMAGAGGAQFWYNRRWYQYTGATFLEMQRGGWQQVHHPDHMERVLAAWRLARERGETWEDTFPLRGRDGEYGWFLSQATPIRDEAGRIVRWFGTHTDVTELRKAKEEFRESEERLRLALAGGQMGAWDVDLVSDSTRWDDKEFELLGLPAHSVTPSTEEFYAVVHPEDRALIRQAVQRAVAEADALEHEFRVVLPDGRIRWVASKGQVLKDDHGKPVRMIGVNFDVTERKRTEAGLRSSAEELEVRVGERTRELVSLHGRLRALTTDLHLTEQRERKRLATDLHDYLAQLLALVRMKLGQMKRLAPPPAQAELVQETEAVVNEALTYTRTLVTQLSPPVLHEFGLPVALKWLAEQMVRQELSVEVRQSGPDRIPLPEDQAVLLFQSVRELLINVRKHASTHQAVVTIDQQGDELRLTVRDEGAGMDMAGGASLDQPSPTSSKFGLFSIRERMLAIGGRFEVDSSPGKGMTATLVAPLTRGAEFTETLRVTRDASNAEIQRGSPLGLESETASRMTHHVSRSSTVRVLLVDDHPMVREGLKGLLRGYTDIAIIGEAWDGEEAIAFVDKLRPDCVIMDINMPKIDGIEATRRIKAAFSAVAIVGLSVNTSREVDSAMRRAGADDFLSKGAPADAIHRAVLAAARKD